MNRQRLFVVITVLVLVAFIGGIILEVGAFPERIDTIPPRPIG